MSSEKRNYTAEYEEKAMELSHAQGSVVEIYRESDVARSRRKSGTYGSNSFPGKENPKLTDEQR